MQLDLSPEDCAAIAALLRDTIAADRLPMSPRIKRMRGVLNKLDPPRPRPTPLPSPKQAREPGIVPAQMRGGWRR